MNKEKYVIFLCSISFINYNAYSQSVTSDDVPKDFRYLLNEETKSVTVEYPNGDTGKINLTVSYNKVRFKEGSESEKQKLYKQLKKNNVKDFFAKKIISQLSTPEGVSNSNGCKGFLSKCIVLTDSFDVVYDSEHNTLRFFFSKNILNKKKNIEVYNDSANYDPAFINKSSIFVNNSNSDTSININDSLIQGFKFGYLDSQFNLSSGNDSSLNKLAYNLDSENKQYKFGFFSDENAMNTTDFIEPFSDSDVFDMSFGSSKNLLLKSSDDNKRLQIYAPSSGLLSIKKDGIYIKQYAVKAGQQDILYSSLPLGIYDINVTIKSSNKIVLDENYTIYNMGGRQLSKSEIDYRFQLGELLDNKRSESYQDDSEDSYWKSYKGYYYTEGKISYGLTDAIMLGGALTIAENDNSVYQVGVNYLASDSASVRATGKMYNGGSYSYDINLYSPILNFGISKFNLNQGDLFAEYTEDYKSNMNINISRIFNLGMNTNLGLYYNYSKYDSAINSNFLSNLSYSVNDNNQLDFQVDYNRIINDNDFTSSNSDSLAFNLIYTYTFDSKSNIRTSFNTNNNNYNQTEIEYNSADLISDNNMGLSVSGRSLISSDNNIYSIDINGDYRNSALSMAYYGSHNSNGNNYQSLSMSSNQVISESGLKFTNRSSDSYLEFNIEKSQDIKDNEALGTVMLDKNGTDTSYFQLDSKNKLISLDNNNLYNSKIDTLSSSIENSGVSNNTVFSHPGTVKSVKMDLTKIVSFVGAYSNILDRDVKNLKCEGEGCVDIENIDGNVYKVAVRSGKPFVLKDKSTNYVCLTPQVRDINVLNIGNSYCVPDPDSDVQNYPIVLQDPKTDKTYNLVFLGIFNDNNKWKYASLLKNDEYDVIERKFGNGSNLVYVNIHDSSSLTNNFNKKLEDISSLADIPRDNLSKYVLLLNDSWN
ncbi:TcfC E-set like domain-containing protein [Photobacterium damselae]|uniref:TcfC E-set like domain-containing protein n=1 Tax=Photobacterium damselae TaxID=38293 RepID=UPI001EDF51C4|nr:TcfC E-set like domain-containing protein [Photobacterium damselae]MCG3846598.1 TcfC E-set like domain-containing protein [Photobacterium damselae]